jgi:hypothetical protein
VYVSCVCVLQVLQEMLDMLRQHEANHHRWVARVSRGGGAAAHESVRLLRASMLAARGGGGRDRRPW